MFTNPTLVSSASFCECFPNPNILAPVSHTHQTLIKIYINQ
ncbi:hypothetical protein HMPREF9418_2131 [Neisseria macacae ATCC 33926]|uniref:Uncharacterized protein n=1 Tax=Neisseria macacae ATCC 33926 TaxID=997348 RepID=A0AA36XKP7_9NEIS|nr:hypothetical protein HMPREF9418_2131 [Neisseria macacae ATCC 33926]